MKRKYKELELETVTFDAEDVITASAELGCYCDGANEFCKDDGASCSCVRDDYSCPCYRAMK